MAQASHEKEPEPYLCGGGRRAGDRERDERPGYFLGPVRIASLPPPLVTIVPPGYQVQLA